MKMMSFIILDLFKGSVFWRISHFCFFSILLVFGNSVFGLWKITRIFKLF
jgi:hypothetical protein